MEATTIMMEETDTMMDIVIIEIIMDVTIMARDKETEEEDRETKKAENST